MADEERSDRPSFTSFWKKSKEALAGKQITFVSSAGGSAAQPSATSPSSTNNGDAGDEESTGLDKSQKRRAQVRKAQIQHRQRKANYIKQLELDVIRIREMIAQTERETTVLRKENESMKARLRAAGPSQQQPQQQPTIAQQLSLQPELPLDQEMVTDFSSPSTTTDLFADIDVNEMTVTLSMDEILGTPCYQISSPSSSSPSVYSMGSPGTAGEAAGLPPQQQLTPEQEQQAINFILSLEHICWDHFRTGNFAPGEHAHDDGTYRSYIPGHALMASTMCLSQAPPAVFEANKGFKKPSSLPFSSSSSSKAASPVISWQTCGLNLQALYGLASSLNPGDQELTPVQAWFELASQYPIELLLSKPVLDTLKREFIGVVKCIHFGAVMEREAFDSVVGRVMAPYLAEPGMAF